MISDCQALEPLSKTDPDIDLEQRRWTLKTSWDLILSLKDIEIQDPRLTWAVQKSQNMNGEATSRSTEKINFSP